MVWDQCIDQTTLLLLVCPLKSFALRNLLVDPSPGDIQLSSTRVRVFFWPWLQAGGTPYLITFMLCETHDLWDPGHRACKMQLFHQAHDWGQQHPHQVLPIIHPYGWKEMVMLPSILQEVSWFHWNWVLFIILTIVCIKDDALRPLGKNNL